MARPKIRRLSRATRDKMRQAGAKAQEAKTTAKTAAAKKAPAKDTGSK